MGSLYAGQYAAHGCPDVSGSAFRVLMRMAIVVLDEDSEPGANDEGMYYGGWKSLTAVLGYGVTEDEDELSNAAKATIARAIRDLKTHGYIASVPRKEQRPHWNRAYRLSLTEWQLAWATRREPV